MNDLLSPTAPSRRLRVGIISAHVHLHSVSKMITRLIASLPRSLFTVILFAFSGPQDYVTSAIKCADILLLIVMA